MFEEAPEDVRALHLHTNKPLRRILSAKEKDEREGEDRDEEQRQSRESLALTQAKRTSSMMSITTGITHHAFGAQKIRRGVQLG
jgi:hypothetical protein